jgi:NAD(P)-dependent dehydrogenase (short-subunit alcohol dehydrogenase family)
MVSNAFRPLLRKGNRKVMINMSSGLGGFGRGYKEIYSTYAISKSALNMLVSARLYVLIGTRGANMIPDVQASE